MSDALFCWSGSTAVPVLWFCETVVMKPSSEPFPIPSAITSSSSAPKTPVRFPSISVSTGWLSMNSTWSYATPSAT